MKLYALLIHGIGVHDKTWAEETIRRLEERVLARLAKAAPEIKVSGAGEIVEFRGFVWDDLFYERQMILHGVLTARSKASLLRNLPGFFNPISFVTGAASDWFAKKIRPLQTKVVSQFVADILAYRDPEAAKLVHDRLDETLRDWPGLSGDEKAPLTFISHSLGTVINSNFVYDRTKGGREFDKRFLFENLFTIGSPLALFSLRYGDNPEAFSAPVRVESPEGRWLNLFDDDDPVGMPLRGLNDAYAKAVHYDVQVDAGLYGLSHVGYFKNGPLLDLVAHKLVLDWLRHNTALPPGRTASLLSEYDWALAPKP